MKQFYFNWLLFSSISGLILLGVHFFEGYKHSDWSLSCIWLTITFISALLIVSNQKVIE